jgi:hypothetical protein
MPTELPIFEPTPIVVPPLPCLKCFNEMRATELKITMATSEISGLYDGKCPVCGWEIYNLIPWIYLDREDFRIIKAECERRAKLEH